MTTEATKNTIILWQGDGGYLSDDELETVLQIRCGQKFTGQLFRGEITKLNIERFCRECILSFFEKGVVKKRHRVRVTWDEKTRTVGVRLVK